MTSFHVKTPFIDNIALNIARLYFRKDRADPRAVRALAEGFHNPPPLEEHFSSGTSIYPRTQGFPDGTDGWDIAFINGSSRVLPPPHGEAGDIIIEDGVLKLQVRHDPAFEYKTARWQRGVAAAQQYNNAYVIGMGGFLPAPGQVVRIDCRMKISAGFHGSTGIWLEEKNTFNPQTGIMVTPFRSFGFSYLGESSDPYISGLAVETVLGLSIQGKHTVTGVDVSQWHTYSMLWAWKNNDKQQVDFLIDDRLVGSLPLHPFGPSEVQLWADNYQIGRGMKIGYLNVPEMDETHYDWIRISVQE